MRPKDAKWFRRAFADHPEIRICNGRLRNFAMDETHGLLLTGGADIAPDYLKQEVPDASVIKKDPNPRRDEWEFEAAKQALSMSLPIFAICKGLQVFNVTLGGTLRLDIPGHNSPEMRDHDVQPLRAARGARHRFEMVNSSHHQAIDRLADGLEVEAWSASDDIIEQVRLRDYPFALAVQYHPERGEIYGGLFEEFVRQVK
jgi:putative glutamine amidotransferase